MKNSYENRLDEACDQFENAWSQEHSGPESIRKFLRHSDFDSAMNTALVVSLIQIDLERTWMTWDADLGKNKNISDEADTLRQFEKIPRLEAYASLFLNRVEFEASLETLANIESSCRDHWGDAIGTAYYRHHYGIEVLPNGHHESRRIKCEIDQPIPAADTIFPLRGHSIIGRQRSADTSDCFVSEGIDGNRIVIAGRHESMISREQLSIQLLSPKFAAITNLSQVNAIRLGDEQLLHPRQSRVIAFPFTIWLPGRRLFCF